MKKTTMKTVVVLAIIVGVVIAVNCRPRITFETPKAEAVQGCGFSVTPLQSFWDSGPTTHHISYSNYTGLHALARGDTSSYANDDGDLWFVSCDECPGTAVNWCTTTWSHCGNNDPPVLRAFRPGDNWETWIVHTYCHCPVVSASIGVIAWTACGGGGL